MEIPGLSNNTTENLKQKKIISWALVDQATDESSGPNQLKSINLANYSHLIYELLRSYHANFMKLSPLFMDLCSFETIHCLTDLNAQRQKS